MARSSKPISLVQGHVTKAQIAQREKAEQSLLTGEPMREWPSTKADSIAHNSFVRLRKLFRAIGKDDGLCEAVINRYCMILSDCDRCEKESHWLKTLLDDMQAQKSTMEYDAYLRKVMEITAAIQKNDSLLQRKRRMLLEIERENIMTIASQLRSVPKEVAEEEDDPMAQLLSSNIPK